VAAGLRQQERCSPCHLRNAIEMIPRATLNRSHVLSIEVRGVAQHGRALRSGRRGRWFKSSHPDHFPNLKRVPF
jgi:hypothetical protein